ncbi:MAG: type I phosphomannose isomerase catalytic subunit [Verrucomicrobiota bacterium]|nr:type I phosphomannose isomerase catalytic subunit [Verrucomicrobiota bacterium]
MNLPLYPLKFDPIYQERVWGGRNLESVFGRKLPTEGKPIGESWEICDRPEANNLVVNGHLAGKTLHEVIQLDQKAIMGDTPLINGQFPLLIKLLDAQERLSLQVHPPAEMAEVLKGEPKTEMWYVAQATTDAHLIAGLQKNATRASFEASLKDNSCENQCYRFPVTEGDVMFLPSGRLHAIDAGNVIVEIQQNSDTTYRVYDWGRPRELHIEKSLDSINFNDFEPKLSARLRPTDDFVETVKCDYFTTIKRYASKSFTVEKEPRFFEIWIALDGDATLNGETFSKGDSILIPADLTRLEVNLTGSSLSWLMVMP